MGNINLYEIGRNPNVSNAPLSSSSTVKQKPTIDFSSRTNEEASRKTQKFLETIDDVLEKPFMETSVIEKNGEKYLVLKRKNNDKDRPGHKGVSELSMASFKRQLGLKDGVIRRYNDSKEVTDRPKWSDSGTIEKGASLLIPLNELGQEYYFFRGDDNKKLKQAVNQYLK